MFNELIFLFTHPDNLFFSVCATVCLLVLGLLMISAISGFDLASDGVTTDIDVSPTSISEAFSWLGFGRIPMLIWLVIFFGGWSMYGFLIQSFIYEILGAVLVWMIAVPVAFIINLPGTAFTCRVLKPLIPRNESYAISINDLVGRTATIVIGTASYGKPTEAKVIDQYGATHYIMIEPEDPFEAFSESESIAISDRNGNTFKGIRLPNLDTQNKIQQG